MLQRCSFFLISMRTAQGSRCRRLFVGRFGPSPQYKFRHARSCGAIRHSTSVEVRGQCRVFVRGLGDFCPEISGYQLPSDAPSAFCGLDSDRRRHSSTWAVKRMPACSANAVAHLNLPRFPLVPASGAWLLSAASPPPDAHRTGHRCSSAVSASPPHLCWSPRTTSSTRQSRRRRRMAH